MRRRDTGTRATVALLVLASAAAAAGGPLDAEDRAKVGMIDATVDDQLDRAADINAAADKLIAISEHEELELDFLIRFTDAELELDLERMLLDVCAPACAAAPASAPAPSSAPGPARCWDCAPPRLLISNANGGHLDDVLALVESTIIKVETLGLPADVIGARGLLDLALTARAAGESQAAFTSSCRAYAVLSCREPDPGPFASGTGTAATGFAGYGVRRQR